MKQVQLTTVVLFWLCLIGCATDTATVEMEPPLDADQLVSTLEEIAETGNFTDVQTSLTSGLEKQGHMAQAVAVQTFQKLSGPDEVKKLARNLAKQLRSSPARS